MKLVYIAGPYRSDKECKIWQNILRAEEYGKKIIAIGNDFFPVIPHKNTAFFGGLRDAQYFLDGTLELLKCCDYILMVPGWETSEGSIKERQYAKENNIKEIKFMLLDTDNYTIT